MKPSPLLIGIVARFMLGGTIVSGFAVLGEMFRPKTFAGLFGAAPSVALTALLLTVLQEGRHSAAVEARSMILGAVALVIYCGICVRLTQRARPNLWIDTSLAWGGWLAPALALWWLRFGGTS
jgi:Kef-type K+ transport system membrane component KefB